MSSESLGRVVEAILSPSEIMGNYKRCTMRRWEFVFKYPFADFFLPFPIYLLFFRISSTFANFFLPFRKSLPQ